MTQIKKTEKRNGKEKKRKNEIYIKHKQKCGYFP